jgi:hypothetical protein
MRIRIPYTIILFVTLLVTVVVRSASSAPAPELVVFPSPEIEFIIGPQVKSGTSAIPGASWFDQTATDRGLSLCAAFPDVAHTPGNVPISGTVSVTKGSTSVTGVGTHFLSEVKEYAIISNGSSSRRLIKIVSSVQSDTQLTLTLPWEGETGSSRTISAPSGQEMDSYQGYQMYYNFILTQYGNYHRTGNVAFRDCARKAADSWYSQPIIDEGKNLVSISGDSLAPRMAAVSGLMLRALDGRPEMWPWIKDYVEYQFHLWDEIRIDYPGFYFGVRDGSFMLMDATNLAATHPEPAVRADFKARALRVAVGYYARLQSTDGSYRWNDEDFPFSGSEQPFQVGILNEAMIQVHRLTGDATIRAAILKSADHEYTKSYNRTWGGMYYFVHGTIGNPPVNCETGCGAAANSFPPADTSQISEVRQLNATALHVFGYAFLLSGDASYLTRGDEIFAATYSGSDGWRGLANTRGKEYDESYRSGGRYLAWRAGATNVPLPSPTPLPSPSPTPTPLPSPSATPTPSVPNPTPTPTPTPTPGPTPAPCTMTVSTPVIPQWSTGKLVVNLFGLSSPATVSATQTSGQVTVNPPQTRSVSGSSVIVEFGLQTKKKSSGVVVSGPCGTKTVQVTVQ